MFLRTQMTSIEVCSPTAVSRKPVCNCPQPSIPKLIMVYGILPLKQSCVWSCTPQVSSLWVFLESLKKTPEFFCCLCVFSNPKDTNQKPIIRCHYPWELQKIRIFPKALGCPICFYYGFVTQHLPPPHVTDTSVLSPPLPVRCLTNIAPKEEHAVCPPVPACEGLSTWAALSHLCRS